MKKTKSKLSEYWDNLIAERIPLYIHFNKVEEEIKEHFTFLKWTFKRILLPIIVFYVIVGIFLRTNVLGSLVIALLIFLYSNFLPDIDFLMKEAKKEERVSKWYEKYALLFFAPIVIYYILDGRKKPIYTEKGKSFHNFKTALIYGIFLFIVGAILWQESIKMLVLPFFGVLGFSFHLMVDGRIKNIFHKHFQKESLKRKGPII
ncbi:hypothetical protein HYX19_02010 [Candidatus Woesearchaeota archaeon]|nr:hypothetical protein [Candidatus Woesearchaeota archaeon]